jgi:hypothetical protein
MVSLIKLVIVASIRCDGGWRWAGWLAVKPFTIEGGIALRGETLHSLSNHATGKLVNRLSKMRLPPAAGLDSIKRS